MSLFTDLKSSPAELPVSSRFTVLNGLSYLAFGLLLVVWPGAVQVLLRDPPFAGQEAALFRVLGMAVAIIGWFYVFGGRSGGRQVVAASVLNRTILVPAVLVPLAVADVFPHVLLLFAILDPTLGLIACYLLRRERQTFPPAATREGG